MAVIPVGYAQASFIHTSGDTVGEAVCTLGFDASGTDPTAVAETLTALWEPVVEGSMHSDMVFVKTVVKFGPNATGLSGEFLSGINGNQGADLAGPQVAMLIQKRTLQGGRRNRGRMFLPGCVDSIENSTGLWTSAYVDQVQLLIDAFFDDMVAASQVPAILHSDNTDPVAMSGFIVQPRSGTQRRRNRR